MAPRKARAQAQAQAQVQAQTQAFPSDYETDAAPSQPLLTAPTALSNEELNLKVVRRHYPSVLAIHKVAPYAVLYTFNLASEAWEKVGVEGTLFICQLAPSPTAPTAVRSSLVILNRRSLENFEFELVSPENQDLSDDFVILNYKEEEQGVDIAYGLWIFSEPAPSSTANARVETFEIMQALAKLAEDSRQQMDNVDVQETQLDGATLMGRQLSLTQLFGQQRQQDAGFSGHSHGNGTTNGGPSEGVSLGYLPQSNAGMGNDVLGQLFMNAKQAYNGAG